MEKILIFGLMIAFCTLSCTNKSINKQDIPVDTIDISKSLIKHDLFSLSAIASNPDYIKLQSDSTCYLAGQIFVKYFENKFYISDRKNLLSFSKDGKFISSFGKVGRGPGEYMEITDFTILPGKDELAILCAGCNKIYFYNLNGKFLKEVRVDFFPTKLIYFNDKLVCINERQYRKLSDYYSVSILSENGEIQKRLIYRKNEEGEKGRLPFASTSLYTLNNTLNYYEPLYDTLWRISPDFKITSKSTIYFGEDKLLFNDISISLSERLSLAKTHVVFEKYFDTDNYIFITLGNKGLLNNIVFDKSSEKSYNLPFNSGLRVIGIASFYNDIDGGPPFWPTGIISGDKVFSLIQVSTFKKYYDTNKDQLIELEKSPNGKLVKILEQSSINDNPIIMIVSLKDLNIKPT